MKKITVILCLMCILPMLAFAKDNTNKAYVGINGGITMPMGDFFTGLEGGNGLAITAEGAYFFGDSRKNGLVLQYNYKSYTIDWESTGCAYLSIDIPLGFGIGYVRKVYSTDKHQINGKILFNAGIGSEIFDGNTDAPAYDETFFMIEGTIGGDYYYHISRNFSLHAGINYFYGNYSYTKVNEYGRYDMSIDFKNLNIQAGITYSF